MIQHQKQNSPPTQQQQPRIHRLGDGLHPLSVYRIEPGKIAPLSSISSILLLFVIWAHRKGFDPVSIYSKANPDKALLRPDRLMVFIVWTELPEKIDTQLLIADLTSMEEHQLCKTLQQIETGQYQPEPVFTHWVVTEDGQIAGEARELDPPNQADEQGQHFCYVRLFAMPECAEYGYTNAPNLRPKHESIGGPKGSRSAAGNEGVRHPDPVRVNLQ